jgi:hypothetical protein
MVIPGKQPEGWFISGPWSSTTSSSSSMLLGQNTGDVLWKKTSNLLPMQ